LVRRREYFRIHQFRRIYDRAQGKFRFQISYSTSAELTPRTIAVAEAFGLGADEERTFQVLDTELKIGPSDIVYITGDSGSGKSVLLNALEKDIRQGMKETCINISDVRLHHNMPLIETVGETIEQGLEMLSKVGLNDAFLFLRTYRQLSDGQKYRYRIAKAIESKAQFWIADEFAATLDRDTAKIVAFNLQKLARALGRSVIVATTHRDLIEDLRPSVHIHKRFGKEITINYYPNEPAAECTLAREMEVHEGSRVDWLGLAGFHYRSHNLGAVRKIFALKRGEELCGVIVYAYPPPASHGRAIVLPKMAMHDLNKQLCSISRVVIHPKYRTMGLGALLIRQTLPLAGTPCVEMSAVMAKYNPFGEKAGMRKVALQQPAHDAVSVAETLQDLGFSLQLLGGQRYVSEKLAGLNPNQISLLKRAFCKHAHPRFRKEIHTGMIFGDKKTFEDAIQKAEVPKLAQLIKITGLLLQTKVYLFWKKGDAGTG
jgi:ABC-type lipoprotein export system ATPase subunit